MTACDFSLLLAGVAAEFDDLHAIAQGRRKRFERVGGGDEHDFGEIERLLEVMIGERRVLLRVEDLEQRGLGAAAPGAR